MPDHKIIGTATVVWLGLNFNEQSVATAVPHLLCHVDQGLYGDRHAGPRLSDVREEVLRDIGVGKEVPIANMRQFSALSVEELIAIWHRMGFTDLTTNEYGLLGENLILSGFAGGISQLPPGSLLTFGRKKGNDIQHSKVVLAVWGENNPCVVPHRNIQEHYPDRQLTQPFAKAGKDLRGVVGFVYCGGKIKLGDSVTIWIPANHPIGDHWE